MSAVHDVRARPGGRVTLHFDATGYRPEPRTGVVGWLLDDLGCGLSVVLLVIFGVGAVYAWEADRSVLAGVLAALALPWALVVVARFGAEVVGELLGYLMLAGIVLLFPLLVFPGVRRWLRARRAEPPVARRAPGEHIPVDALGPATLTRTGTEVTVVVPVDGTPVVYSARDDAGHHLEHEFRRLLAGRLTVVN